MPLAKKIVVNFFISAVVIAVLAVVVYGNFVAIRREIRFLELTDEIRSNSLQLRRHEKNYFLYASESAAEESKAIHRYLDQLDDKFEDTLRRTRNSVVISLHDNVRSYRRSFDTIEVRQNELAARLSAMRGRGKEAERAFPLLAAAIRERPRQAAEFLRAAYGIPPGHPVLTGLADLDARISALRKNGEDIIANAKELDRTARSNVDTVIRLSQAAILIVFPVFLVTGVTLLFLTTRNVVSRLRLLIDIMKQSGKGKLAHVKAPVEEWGNDEVGLLIRQFDDLEHELERRQADVEEKNRELLQSKKLAAIGTLAAGVAHELNNPLSNIYLSIQVLVREIGDSVPAEAKDAANDIMSQTVRVKRIVGDLLEFARGREPQFQDVELNALIRGVLDRFRVAGGQVEWAMEPSARAAFVRADPDQLERVFINLFTNASEAAVGASEVRVAVTASESDVRVRVSDRGRGIPKDALDKIFEPFFTTKDKGTGLGLAIVFNTIQKHGGDIAVDSEQGRGTTFAITLPLARAPAA